MAKEPDVSAQLIELNRLVGTCVGHAKAAEEHSRSTDERLLRMNGRLDEHIADDTRQFSDVKGRLNRYAGMIAVVIGAPALIVAIIELWKVFR